jgi:hypothetical protein
MDSLDSSLCPQLTDLEVISLRGIAARQQLALIKWRAAQVMRLDSQEQLAAAYSETQLEVTRDLAIVFGEIETRCNLEGGTILTGNYSLSEDGRLVPGGESKQ